MRNTQLVIATQKGANVKSVCDYETIFFILSLPPSLCLFVLTLRDSST